MDNNVNVRLLWLYWGGASPETCLVYLRVVPGDPEHLKQHINNVRKHNQGLPGLRIILGLEMPLDYARELKHLLESNGLDALSASETYRRFRIDEGFAPSGSRVINFAGSAA